MVSGILSGGDDDGDDGDRVLFRISSFGYTPTAAQGVDETDSK